MRRSRIITTAVAAATLALAASACGSPGQGAEGSDDELKVAVLTSQTGLLAEYGKEYIAGFEAGLDHATGGTGEIDGTKIEVEFVDDQGKANTAVAKFKDLVGQGYDIIGGTADSGIALKLAPLAEQNKVLYISGPAAADALTGINDYTFRSGRQTWQDVATSGKAVGDIDGKKVTVFAQDTAFGEANVAAVETVLGGQGAEVEAMMVPTTATDFTPFALKAKQSNSDLVFVAWAGDTTGPMWKALTQQGVFESSTVVTGLATIASFQLYGPASDKIQFLSHYFADAPDNDVNKAMVSSIEENGGQADLFAPDGFVAAQMMVHALEEGGSVDDMIDALEGWTFEGPKGETTIREGDHAVLQPSFLAKLVKEDGAWAPELVEELPADAIAPPEAD